MSKIRISIKELKKTVQEFKKSGTINLPPAKKEDKLISPKKANKTKIKPDEEKLDEAVSMKLSEISVDDQIDSMLIGYEEDSTGGEDTKRTTYENVNVNMFDKYMKPILEAEGLPPPPEGEEEQPEPKYTDSSETNTDYRSEPQKPKININSFSEKVARLIINKENLLDVKTVIFNRAMNFLKTNYDEETSTKFEEIMESENDISLDQEYGEEHFKSRPYGIGAGPAVGGGI